MAKKKSLLDELIETGGASIEAKSMDSDDVTLTSVGSSLQKLRVDEIVPNRHQPRQHFDPEKIAVLAESMKRGSYQPIQVRPVEGKYELIAGERRWRAAQLNNWETIDAIVTCLSHEDSAISALAENIARENLTDWEIARALKSLEENFPTRQALAEKVGLKRQDVVGYMAFFQLPASWLDYLQDRPTLLTRASVASARPILNQFGDDPRFWEISQAALEALENGDIGHTSLGQFMYDQFVLQGHNQVETPPKESDLVANDVKPGSATDSSLESGGIEPGNQESPPANTLPAKTKAPVYANEPWVVRDGQRIVSGKQGRKGLQVTIERPLSQTQLTKLKDFLETLI
jgi:ParB family chromosome partitioning protein